MRQELAFSLEEAEGAIYRECDASCVSWKSSSILPRFTLHEVDSILQADCGK